MVTSAALRQLIVKITEPGDLVVAMKVVFLFDFVLFVKFTVSLNFRASRLSYATLDYIYSGPQKVLNSDDDNRL